MVEESLTLRLNVHSPDNDDSWADLCSFRPSCQIGCLLLDKKLLMMTDDDDGDDGICRRELSGFHTEMIEKGKWFRLINLHSSIGKLKQ